MTKMQYKSKTDKSNITNRYWPLLLTFLEQKPTKGEETQKKM